MEGSSTDGRPTDGRPTEGNVVQWTLGRTEIRPNCYIDIRLGWFGFTLCTGHAFTLELHASANFSPITWKKINCFIKKYVEINILQAIIITYTNTLWNKTIIFINGNDLKEHPWQSHSKHTRNTRDILNGTDQSQASADCRGMSPTRALFSKAAGRCSELKVHNILHLFLTILYISV